MGGIWVVYRSYMGDISKHDQPIHCGNLLKNCILKLTGILITIAYDSGSNDAWEDYDCRTQNYAVYMKRKERKTYTRAHESMVTYIYRY